jgi:hypothetical protein
MGQPHVSFDGHRSSGWPGVSRLRRAMARHPLVVDSMLASLLAVGPALAGLLDLVFGHTWSAFAEWIDVLG